MIVDFLLVALAFYLSIPAVVGYTAYCYGRSFWVWFALGAVLPVFAHILLFVLIRKDISTNQIGSLLTRDEQIYMDRQIQELEGPSQKAIKQ